MDKKKNNSKNDSQMVIPYGYMPYCPPEEDEIDLREIIKVLKRRKRTILIFALVSLMAAAAYLLFAKPIFEAKATVQIGKELVKNEDGTYIARLFDNANSVKQYLDIKYDTAGKYRDKNASAYISAVQVPKKGASGEFFTVTALGFDNKVAVDMLQKALDDIFLKHRLYFDSVIEQKKSAVESLKEQLYYYKNIDLPQLKRSLEILKTEDTKKIEDKIALKSNYIAAMRQKIKEREKEIKKKEAAITSIQKKMAQTAKKDPALATMSAMQVANLQNDISQINMQIIDLQSQIKKIEEETIPNLEAKKRRLLEEVIPSKKASIDKLVTITIPKIERDIKELKISMKEPYLVMSKVVGKIYTKDKPVKPKKTLILAVSLITGLMLGVFMALFMEFLSSKKEEDAIS
ncbi:MAG: Wzz/FepE/Etk N-terminal domain-containing protein [Hydrogenimonas sp.]|nr:Wzz/FepE/Etk N-terminal domain-containing protein [Hydrogenimonas sp.]